MLPKKTDCGGNQRDNDYDADETADIIDELCKETCVMLFCEFDQSRIIWPSSSKPVNCSAFATEVTPT
jgi:hypothetical protein